MRHLLPIAWLLAVLATATSAQLNESFAIWKSHDLVRGLPPSIYEISSTGSLKATLATFSANSTVTVLGVRNDNQTLLLTGYTRVGTTFTMFLADLRPGQPVTTVYSGAPLYAVVGAVPTSDGDTFILNLPSGSTSPRLEIYRLRGTTLSPYSKSTVSLTTYGGFDRDPETGSVCFKGHVLAGPSSRYGYYRIDPHTGAITQFELVDGARYATASCRDTIYDFPAGHAIDLIGDATGYGQTIRITPGQGVTLLSQRWWGRVPSGLVRASQRTPGVAYYTISPAGKLPGGFMQNWDLTQIRPDGTWGKSSYLTGNPPIANTGLVRLGSRHLSWRMASPPNDRTLELSFPGESGRSYAVLFSLSGIRPAPALPDGRVIPIRIDSLTLLSAQGGVAGVLEGTVGRLGAGGRGTVKVNTNRFGTGLKGTKVWAAALVFDPKSMGGIAWIVGPELLEIRQ